MSEKDNPPIPKPEYRLQDVVIYRVRIAEQEYRSRIGEVMYSAFRKDNKGEWYFVYKVEIVNTIDGLTEEVSESNIIKKLN